MEAKAILISIKAIHQTCLQNKIGLEIEPDAFAVIKVLVGEDDDPLDLKPLMDSIASLSSYLREVIYTHCNRLANSIAHRLARVVVSLFFWRESGESPFEGI